MELEDEYELLMAVVMNDTETLAGQFFAYVKQGKAPPPILVWWLETWLTERQKVRRPNRVNFLHQLMMAVEYGRLRDERKGKRLVGSVAEHVVGTLGGSVSSVKRAWRQHREFYEFLKQEGVETKGISRSEVKAQAAKFSAQLSQHVYEQRISAARAMKERYPDFFQGSS